jgi:alkylation response protein AidB-like acyl-CoA dehydrogenase
MVDLIASTEQQMIVDSVAGFLAAALPVSRLRPGHSGSDGDHWRRMGEMGLFSLSVLETNGGSGLSAIEEALVFRQLGRHLLSPNVIASLIGARIAQYADDRSLLAAIISGKTRVTLAQRRGVMGAGEHFAGSFQLYDPDDGDWILIVDEAGGAALFERTSATDERPLSSAVDALAIHLASIDSGPYLAAGPELGSAAQLRLLAGAMLAGVCDGTRDLASEYAKTREQFGQPIGAFQAVKHKCADMCVRADAVGSLLSYASIGVALGRSDAAFQTTALKLLAGQYALINAKDTIQVHGGIGFTVECDAHHFLKRAHVYDQIGGSSRRQQQRLLAQKPLAMEDVA